MMDRSWAAGREANGEDVAKVGMMVGKEAIALFVRNPVPGRVKTRLARDLGEDQACEFYRAMVADALHAARSCAVSLYLFHDGAYEGRLPTQWLLDVTEVVTQQGENLGERMAAAFRTLFALGHEKVALLGSDVPGLDSSLIVAALAALDAHDAAIVPAEDGGYCLIALNKQTYHDDVFAGIPWSTRNVLTETLAGMDRCGLQARLLPSRRDIDTLDDLKAYCRNPAGNAVAANRWLAAANLIF